jgi:lipopolysaccharide/colanic/teichoic acid biosynthesis glycosyltransferase
MILNDYKIDYVHQPHSPSDDVMEPAGKILYIGSLGREVSIGLLNFNYSGLTLANFTKAFYWMENQVLGGHPLPTAIVADFDLSDGNAFNFYHKISSNRHFRSIPFIVLARNCDTQYKVKALKIGIDDFYIDDFSADDLHDRIQFLLKFKKLTQTIEQEPEVNMSFLIPMVQMPVMKRLIDILFSATVLILLSPLLILIAILIKLESPGPVFYVSKRAGKGYHIFDFYKFRSMRAGADRELNNLKHLNQYSGVNGSSSFVKIDNDPRVTRLGKFLRNSSIDELPQLINVLKGDMSLVGNRPLPLYEAEQLTRDQWAKRFLAPAGITGLWQIAKRGKADMSEDERMELDVSYAERSSFWFDLLIIFRTVPAMLQRQNV